MRPISIYKLPSEILEHVLLSLHPAEILRMKEVFSSTTKPHISINRLTLLDPP